MAAEAAAPVVGHGQVQVAAVLRQRAGEATISNGPCQAACSIPPASRILTYVKDGTILPHYQQ